MFRPMASTSPTSGYKATALYKASHSYHERRRPKSCCFATVRSPNSTARLRGLPHDRLFFELRGDLVDSKVKLKLLEKIEYPKISNTRLEAKKKIDFVESGYLGCLRCYRIHGSRVNDAFDDTVVQQKYERKNHTHNEEYTQPVVHALCARNIRIMYITRCMRKQRESSATVEWRQKPRNWYEKPKSTVPSRTRKKLLLTIITV
ncbi:unnamed protein product, partial [Trichogramma brassicae]